MSTDVDPKTGGVKLSATGPEIELAGHGLVTTSYQGMAKDLIDQLTTWIGLARTHVEIELIGDPTKTVITKDGATFELWNPYEAFDAPGAWWLRIPEATWKSDWSYASIADVLHSVPRTVAHAPGGTGYHAPADKKAVYFPLYQPRVGAKPPADEWHTYLAQRAASATFRVPTALDPLATDWRLAVGLYYHGSTRKMTVVRPKVRP
jgi:hypothetical protein